MKVTAAIKKALLPEASASEALAEIKALSDQDKSELAQLIRDELGWEVEE